MKLSLMEKESALWRKIDAELNSRLQVMREKNDCNLDQLETATLRGSVKVIKEILGWAKPTPQIIGDLGPPGGN